MPNIPQLMTTAEVAEQCGGCPSRRSSAGSNPAPSPPQKLPGLRGAYVHPAEVARFKSAREAVRMTDTQALIGLLAALALVPVVIACALVVTRRDN